MNSSKPQDADVTPIQAVSKVAELEPNREAPAAMLTTNQGVGIVDNQNTLKAGTRGPSLLEDFIYREKITHFDHERIPERVVHARGHGAHGYFQVYESLAPYTRAHFLQDPAVRTPVFVRFSTVQGSRGSADTVRDVRGFATKFYTQEGIFDLVANNIPVFFIQDAIKFPDLVHALKPEPHNEVPQGSTAHDTFWDYISVTPESAHMIMWAMSDRAIPRSNRMMEGFGVHTFRLVNAEGVSTFVKFHWKPLLGIHGLSWDEAQTLAGRDPDFHRRDLWEAIETGNYPEWELGLQLITEEDMDKLDFDLLDSTKIIPEEIIPVKRVGKMVLNRNPDYFFGETEQVAFHIGHVVPGIDFTNDPLLQGRLFSYTDTQLLRLGGPNFHQIPINRPINPVYNNQRDGFHQHRIYTGRVAYEPNTLAGGLPKEAPPERGFVTYPDAESGPKLRDRSHTFMDHYTQARMFWLSMTQPEQDHIVEAFSFELGRVETVTVRARIVTMLQQVDATLAQRVADNLGLALEGQPGPTASTEVMPSPALSMIGTGNGTIRTRKVAILAADGVDVDGLKAMKEGLEAAGALTKIISVRLGGLVGAQGGPGLPIDATPKTMPSVMFDAVFVPCGPDSLEVLKANGDMLHFVMEAYKHCKPIAAAGYGVDLLRMTGIVQDGVPPQDGVLLAEKGGADKALAQQFVQAIGMHRFWMRADKMQIPA
ncbi:catalase [Gulbenkiania mobilis]|uniref:Catalase n=1 Tax=Gulbenkiania mobilis TaxID=397457 RepID=A0ABY2D0L9_GULMO|nr:catalase [Gulbenkiania mobilis]